VTLPPDEREVRQLSYGEYLTHVHALKG
jgi:hypothetical protein